MADSLLDLVGVPGGTPPSPNQDVLAQIARDRAWWDANVNTPGSGQGPMVGNDYWRAAAEPGMSGYFETGPGGGIAPKVFSPQQVAEQSGISLGELGGSFTPRTDVSGNANFQLPRDDRGGFFRASDLYGPRLPGIYSQGAGGLSTNNWRLLGRGPGTIMRNGRIIDVGAARHSMGFPSMGGPGSGVSGEVEMSHVPRIPFGSGSMYGWPNAFMGNYGQSTYAGWPGDVNGWTDVGSRAVT